MTKIKSTKHALLMSALSLLLCVSLFISTSYAWFTDTVTSASNILKSGNLDVEMYWADGAQNPDNTEWIDASKGAIFNYELWEPGYVSVRHIKIANEGSLALSYQLSVVANGTVSKLADVIDVYYMDPALKIENRTQLNDANRHGTLTEVLEEINITASRNLEAGQNHTITLALKMQESAGNEYQEMSIGSDFSIRLVATQFASESDSFNNQYDADAGDGTSNPIPTEGLTFLYEAETDSYTVTGYAGTDPLTELVIPATHNDGANGTKPVTKVGANAFKSQTQLTNIDIPSSVTEIGSLTFEGCIALESLIIPESVDLIGEHAFRGCSTLKTVEIKGDTLLKEGAFWYCVALERLSAPKMTASGTRSFGCCTSLTKVEFPSVIEIQDRAFFKCTSLTEIEIPSVVNIQERAFDGCTALDSVGPLKQVKTIGQYAFQGCSSLKTLEFEKITEIGNHAFIGCTALENVGSLKNVITIGESAFRTCSSLKSVDLEKVTEIGYGVFSLCTALESVGSLKNVITIGEYAFGGCFSLKSVDLEKVEEIGKQTFLHCTALESVGCLKNAVTISSAAFVDCPLKSVTLEKVTEIGTHAFHNCSALEIHYEGSEADWNTKVTVESNWKDATTPLFFSK